MAATEFECWRVTEKMIKDPEDRAEVQSLIVQNYGWLKQIFINLASKSSSYPALTLLDLTHFCDKCDLYDKNLNSSAGDRAFIATRLLRTGIDVPLHSGNALCRFQFYEYLVRIASEKFRA
jgi:hypothetical protein